MTGIFVILCIAAAIAIFIQVVSDENEKIAFQDWDGKDENDWF